MVVHYQQRQQRWYSGKVVLVVVCNFLVEVNERIEKCIHRVERNVLPMKQMLMKALFVQRRHGFIVVAREHAEAVAQVVWSGVMVEFFVQNDVHLIKEGFVVRFERESDETAKRAERLSVGAFRSLLYLFLNVLKLNRRRFLRLNDVDDVLVLACVIMVIALVVADVAGKVVEVVLFVDFANGLLDDLRCEVVLALPDRVAEQFRLKNVCDLVRREFSLVRTRVEFQYVHPRAQSRLAIARH